MPSLTYISLATIHSYKGPAMFSYHHHVIVVIIVIIVIVIIIIVIIIIVIVVIVITSILEGSNLELLPH